MEAYNRTARPYARRASSRQYHRAIALIWLWRLEPELRPFVVDLGAKRFTICSAATPALIAAEMCIISFTGEVRSLVILRPTFVFDIRCMGGDGEEGRRRAKEHHHHGGGGCRCSHANVFLAS